MITATSMLRGGGGVPGGGGGGVGGGGGGVAEEEDRVQEGDNGHDRGGLDAEGGRGRAGGGGREDRGQGEGDGDDGEHRGVDAGYSRGEGLGAVLEAAEQQARAEHEEHVADDGADDRGLDHGGQARREGEDGDDELGGVAEGRVG